MFSTARGVLVCARGARVSARVVLGHLRHLGDRGLLRPRGAHRLGEARDAALESWQRAAEVEPDVAARRTELDARAERDAGLDKAPQ